MKRQMYKKIIATSATSAFVASAIVPAAMAAAPTDFKDVSSTYKEAVDYLVAQEITNGISETQFGTTQNIKRGDAAVFIARALGLDTTNAKDQGFKDLNGRVKGAVNAIVEAKIASGKTADSFAPDQNITRQEMAKMLVNAYDLTAETEAGFKDVNANWIGYVSALKDNGITFGKTETTFAPTANLTRGEFALFMFRAESLEIVEPEEPVTEPAIVSIASVNPTTAKVTFNMELDSLKASDVKVKNSVTNGNLVVKSVKLADDKKSAEITFYEAFASNGAYTIDITSGKNQLSGSLAVGSLSVATIVMENQTIPAGTATEIAVKLYDETGADVTEQFKNQVKFVSDAKIEGNKITLEKGTSASVKAVFEKDGKVVAESNSVTIQAQANTPVKLSNWTVATAQPTFDDKFVRNTIVYAKQDASIFTEVVDQFGAVIPNPTVTFESLTPHVAVVDQTTGKIQVLGSGAAKVRVTAKDGDKVAFDEIVNLEVRDVPAVTTLSLSQQTLALSTKDAAGKEIQATVLDQFGNVLENQAVTVKERVGTSYGPAALKVPEDKVETNDKGIATFKVAALNSAAVGNRLVDVTVGTGDTAVTTTLAVELKEPGVFARYDVRGLKSTLDLNNAADAQGMTIDVVAVDASGLMIKPETPTITVTNPAGETTPVSGNKIVLDSNAKAGDVYKVDIKVGEYTVSTSTFTVINSTPAEVEPSILFTTSTVNVEAGETLADAIERITELRDGDGYKVASVIGASANSKVVTVEDGALVKAPGKTGTTTIYVKSVVIKNDAQTVEKTITFDKIVDLTVNVK